MPQVRLLNLGVRTAKLDENHSGNRDLVLLYARCDERSSPFAVHESRNTFWRCVSSKKARSLSREFLNLLKNVNILFVAGPAPCRKNASLQQKNFF
jgi:hypothetical protein